jgi:lysyl oxidase-like protein 2/3/4
MDNLYCTGEEKNLSGCRFDGWGANDCTSSEAAGVVCLSPEITATEEPTTTPKPPKKELLLRIKVFNIYFELLLYSYVRVLCRPV